MKTKRKKIVFLLHGFMKSSKSMRFIRHALLEEGFEVISIDYPTRKYNIKYITDNYIYNKVLEFQNINNDLYFIGHSMGGVIFSYMLLNYEILNAKKALFIASPLKGSIIADFVSKLPLIRSFCGPGIKDLSYKSNFISTLNLKFESINNNKHNNIEFGTIIGEKSKRPLISNLIFKQSNDGVISTKSALFDFFNFKVKIYDSHNALLRNHMVHKTILNFLYQ